MFFGVWAANSLLQSCVFLHWAPVLFVGGECVSFFGVDERWSDLDSLRCFFRTNDREILMSA
jgi:hypothetical protein